jgi:hypothetical protein
MRGVRVEVLAQNQQGRDIREITVGGQVEGVIREDMKEAWRKMRLLL